MKICIVSTDSGETDGEIGEEEDILGGLWCGSLGEWERRVEERQYAVI
jgi:hypothetical protein